MIDIKIHRTFIGKKNHIMKKLTLFFVVALIYQATVISQSCLPAGITFDTQTQIDNFQTDYPGCSEIEGNVLIKNDDITNLIGLNVLTSIWGRLRFYDCDVLSSLEGLENITFIGGDLDIYGSSDVLTNLTGLDNLTTIGGGLIVNQTDALTSLTGLENVTTIQGYLQVSGNESLINLTGLDNLISVGENMWIGENTVLTNLTGLESLVTIGEGFEIYTSSLTSLSGLESLSTIGGSFQISYSNYLNNLSALSNLTSIGGGYLEIYDNATLSSLTGLDHITAGSITGLTISENASLATCHVQSVCDYIANPNGSLDISNNATGCNNEVEVETACENMSVPSANIEFDIVFYPNPAHEKFFISSIDGVVISEVFIYNLIGQEFLQIKKPITIIDISKLHPGMYFVEVLMNRGSVIKKLIVK